MRIQEQTKERNIGGFAEKPVCMHGSALKHGAVWTENGCYVFILPPDLLGELRSFSQGDLSLEKESLVARGHLQLDGVDFYETYAPVVKFDSLRIVPTWAAKRHLTTRYWSNS